MRYPFLASIALIFAFVLALGLASPAHSYQDASDLAGEWRGDQSGNSVTITMRTGGFDVVFAQVQRAGQASPAFFYRRTGSGTFQFNSPEGWHSIAQVLGPNSMRVTNSDGWTDLFRRSSPAPSAALVPAPSPKAAPKPAIAEKLPKARPAKMAPWSPNAMSANYGGEASSELSPRFAAERADALASCISPIRQWAAHAGGTLEEALLIYEEASLNDKIMNKSASEVSWNIGNHEKWVALGQETAATPATICLAKRHLAQLQGAPLIAGAVDGTLTPLSIGGQTPPWQQQGKDARIIASDGKSAMDCVKLVELTKTDSSTGGGGRVLSNQCSGPVEIGWCYSPGDCDTETGSGWTVQAGKSWPVSAQKHIRWAACHGKDTTSFVKGSHGLRYYCKAPAKK